MVLLEVDGEAEDHVGGGVRVVVEPQHGGGDGALVDVPLETRDWSRPIEAAVESEPVSWRGRHRRSGVDGGT